MTPSPFDPRYGDHAGPADFSAGIPDTCPLLVPSPDWLRELAASGQRFCRLATGIDATAIRNELEANREAWLEEKQTALTMRTRASTMNILLREISHLPNQDRYAALRTESRPVSPRFPTAIAMAERLAQLCGGTMGKTRLAALKPGAEIPAHADWGLYHELTERIHLVIRNHGGTYFTCGDSTVEMRDGEVWWFDNLTRHHVINTGSLWRTHLIVDLEGHAYRAAFLNQREYSHARAS
jgi:mannose-6-phosphate isomerase-like protein (cupin superfamily)